MNGMNGIGTGFSTSVPKNNIQDVIKNMKRKIMKKSNLSLNPSCNGFKGKIIKIDNKNFISKGIYEVIDDKSIRITELPIGKWTDDYKKFLDSITT